MCGFVISAQPVSHPTGFKAVGTDTLARGPDALKSRALQVFNLKFFVEFTHLYITTPAASQPLETNNWLLVINGEIYNYRELASAIHGDADPLNDAQVFFEHFQVFGLKKTLSRAQGMYAGVLINKRTGVCHGFTDHVGKKPLVIWNSSSGWHAGTGIDSRHMDDETTSFQVLPPGIHDISFECGTTKKIENKVVWPSPKNGVREIISSAVAARIPAKMPFAVALSGGLDSSIIAYFIEKKLRLAPDYYVVGEDLTKSVNSLIKHLGIDEARVKLIRPSHSEDVLQLVQEVIQIVKSYNPSVVSNGIATMLLAESCPP